MEDADCASILIDIYSPILEISSESMFINIISAKRFHRSAKQVQPDRSLTMFHHLRSRFTDQFFLLNFRCFTVFTIVHHKVFACCCREVKAMMNSQKLPWRKKVHSWRIILEHSFSIIFGHDI